MLQKIKAYLEENNLAPAGSKIIIAVSGGLDSVVLADILPKLGYETAIAHCNFGLRAEESNADESLNEIARSQANEEATV